MGAFFLVLLVTVAGATGTQDGSAVLLLNGSKDALMSLEGRARFFARPPIMQKDFDLKKHPEISERALRRRSLEMFSEPHSRMPVVRPDSTIDYKIHVARPDPSMEYRLHRIPPQPEALQNWVQSLRQPLAIGVGDLNVGRYQAVIIQDPQDKRKIRGFFKGFSLSYESQDADTGMVSEGLETLMQYLRDRTQINARGVGTVGLGDDGLFDVPFAHLAGVPETEVILSEAERRNLGQYLENGGFLFVEALGPYGSSEDTSFVQSVKVAVLSVLGDDITFSSLSEKHPLYTSFYDLDGSSLSLVEGNIDGRTVMILSRLDLARRWIQDDDEALKLGVNLTVFALTQPGGIANVTSYAG